MCPKLCSICANRVGGKSIGVKRNLKSYLKNTFQI